jgi:DNA/RNA endonuclease G (NUC1)
VPTHYYKVVLAENSSGKHGDHRAAVGAFVMPNAPIDTQTPVTAFAVPLEALESVAGEQYMQLGLAVQAIQAVHVHCSTHRTPTVGGADAQASVLALSVTHYRHPLIWQLMLW